MKHNPYANNGGDHKGERIVDVEGEINKDYLFMVQDRMRQLRHLREVLADLSEKMELPRGSLLGDERRGEGGLAVGVDDLLVRYEKVRDGYVAKLADCMRMLERVEEWKKGLTPRQQELVEYRFISGHTLIQTAEHFGVHPTSIGDWERKMFVSK